MPDRVRISRRPLLGGLCASLALGAALLAAAGGAAWAQSSAPVDTTKIVMGLDNTGAGFMPLYVADAEGFFKKAGLNYDSVSLSGGTPTTMAALAGGSVNIVNLSTPALVQYAGNKVITGKAFAETLEQRYDVVSTRDITSIPEIKGKNIGISGPNAGDQVYLLGVLQHYGVGSNDVAFTTSGNPVNRLAELTTGAIQATAESTDLRERAAKVGNVLLKAEDSPIAFPSNVFIASIDLINNHKPLLKKFLDAQQQALAWIRADPDAAVPICVKVVGGTPDVCKGEIALYFNHAVSGKYTWSTTFAIDVDGLESALAAGAVINPASKGLTVNDVADTSIAGTTP